jgi:hypothetical protein
MRKKIVAVGFLLVLFQVISRAEVRVFIEDVNGRAAVQYECNGGEVVRAFALDISLDRGFIVGVSNFFTGESRPGSGGYGIFPASFRDHITVSSGTNVNWDAIGYNPLAVPEDAPLGTLAGLNSSGVTLEFGAVWDPQDPAAVPPASGTLCMLALSEGARVSVSPNTKRGGVVGGSADAVISTSFGAAWVATEPLITGVTLSDGILTISFQGGELESASSLTGGWIGTGNNSGHFTEPVLGTPKKFFRVVRQ